MVDDPAPPRSVALQKDSSVQDASTTNNERRLIALDGGGSQVRLAVEDLLFKDAELAAAAQIAFGRLKGPDFARQLVVVCRLLSDGGDREHRESGDGTQRDDA